MHNETPRKLPKHCSPAQNGRGDPVILHILNRSQWDLARRQGVYCPPSLEAEGFIHCSTIAQIIDTANLHYRGQHDLLVLRIDERKLTSPLEFEAPATAGDTRPGT